MKKYLIYALIGLFACMVIEIIIQDRKIDTLTQERDKYKQNTEILLGDVATYKVRDSLNAAKVGTLELSIKEFEKYRATDAELIKDLQGKNKDLDRMNKAQAQTIIALQSVPKDTVIITDSIPITAKKVECGDQWYTFKGLLTDDTFQGTLENRDSLIVAESVQYKKILFWKTNKVKSRETSVVSLNPHTKSLGVESIIIEK